MSPKLFRVCGRHGFKKTGLNFSVSKCNIFIRFISIFDLCLKPMKKFILLFLRLCPRCFSYILCVCASSLTHVFGLALLVVHRCLSHGAFFLWRDRLQSFSNLLYLNCLHRVSLGAFTILVEHEYYKQFSFIVHVADLALL